MEELEYYPGDDPLDLRFVYRSMKVLPPLPAVVPKPEEKMAIWQQFQRLKFEYKERGLPLDGSYQPPPPTGPPTRAPLRTDTKEEREKSGLYRSMSTPQVDKRSAEPASDSPPAEGEEKKAKGITRNQSMAVTGSTSGSWSWASSPVLGSRPSSKGAGAEERRISSVRPGALRSMSISQDKAPQLGTPPTEHKSPTTPHNGDSSNSSSSAANGSKAKLTVQPKKSQPLSDKAGALLSKGRRWQSEGKHEEAAEAMAEMISYVLTDRALCLTAAGDYANAIQDCDIALIYKPENGKAHVRKATALARNEKLLEAKSARAGALAYLKPDDPELWDLNELLGIPNKGSRRSRSESNSGEGEEEGGGDTEDSAMANSVGEGEEKEPEKSDADNGKTKGADLLKTVKELKQREPEEDAPAQANGSGGRSGGAATASASGTTAAPARSSPVAPPRKALSPRDGRVYSTSIITTSSTLLNSSSSVPRKPLPGPPVKKAPPTSAAPTPAVKRDSLQLQAKYSEMSDDELPPLPSEPPAIDEDMARWQQYMRLKAQYKERGLEPRFVDV